MGLRQGRGANRIRAGLRGRQDPGRVEGQTIGLRQRRGADNVPEAGQRADCGPEAGQKADRRTGQGQSGGNPT